LKDPRPVAHPYIPNSAPAVKAEMLKALGIADASELFLSIPEWLRLDHLLNLPPAFRSEYELARHIKSVLAKNKPASGYLNFLGAGCWQHYVPAICDEVASRGEFLTAYTGDTYEDHGRWQAIFEYASLMGELLNMEVISVPTYDWGQAAATSMRMAQRITGRNEIVIASPVCPERMAIFRNYFEPDLSIRLAGHDALGQVDLGALRGLVTDATAGVYFENPSYLGPVQCAPADVARIAHDAGALCLVGVDPSSLGVLAPPADYGADIVTGDLQPLGNHMTYGGGLSGFMASRDEPRFVMEYPTRLVGLTTTAVPGELGFGEVAFDRTSFIEREHGKATTSELARRLGVSAPTATASATGKKPEVVTDP